MRKKALFSLFYVLFSVAVMAGQARNTELVDVPTANTLLGGEIRIDFKFSPGGGILSRIFVGIFDRLYVGGAFNVENVIGSGDISPDLPPNLLAKIRITDDDAAVPAVSLGYDGQGYMNVPAKGLFLAVTKEVRAGIITQLTVEASTNNFTEFGKDIDMGAGLAFAITKELSVCFEIDSMLRQGRGRASFGIGYFFDPIEISIGCKFGYGNGEYAQSRMLKVAYISYF
ncbi:MAG TPA: hypothetical protein P5511_01830 [Candidatus Goldiibacteriota bacterium]|nr:hypothetical protein [Candidatus Goldiibacteriota bacterium]